MLRVSKKKVTTWCHVLKHLDVHSRCLTPKICVILLGGNIYVTLMLREENKK